MLPDALLLLWRLLLLPTVQLLMQLRIRLPQITQPSLHLHELVCIVSTILAEGEGSAEQYMRELFCSHCAMVAASAVLSK